MMTLACTEHLSEDEARKRFRVLVQPRPPRQKPNDAVLRSAAHLEQCNACVFKFMSFARAEGWSSQATDTRTQAPTPALLACQQEVFQYVLERARKGQPGLVLLIHNEPQRLTG